MIDLTNVSVILLMSLATYLTRIGGYLFLKDRPLSPRAAITLEAAPGCILISVIAPYFAAKNPADLIALAIAALTATRLPMLPTVLIGIIASGVLRAIIG